MSKNQYKMLKIQKDKVSFYLQITPTPTTTKKRGCSRLGNVGTFYCRVYRNWDLNYEKLPAPGETTFQAYRIAGEKSLKSNALVQPLWKTAWWFLKDPEIEMPFDPGIPLLGIYPTNYKSFYYKDSCTQMFTASLFTMEKTWNEPKCPLMIDWTGKMWQIYTMEYYAAIKNDEFVSFVGHGWIWRTSFSANWHKNRKWNTAYSHS